MMHWTTLGESVIGTSHLSRQLPCQDAHCVLPFGEGGNWLVIAVADGAGSAAFSQVGARLVCDALVRLVVDIPESCRCTRASVIGAVARAREELLIEADRLNISARELACTALLAVLGPTEAALAQLGDGAIVYSHKEDIKIAFWPESGEYANATDFLTDESFDRLIQVQILSEPISQIAIITDGLQRLALDFATRTAFPGFFVPLFRDVHDASDAESLRIPLREFLESRRVNQRTDDDKTLVLAVRR